MKILFYINTICHGGAERVIVNLSSQFVEKGYGVVLVTSLKTSEEYKVNSKVKRYVIDKQGIAENRILKNIHRLKQLRRICQYEKPDVVISFMAEPNFRAVLATRGLPCKTIISVRNDPYKEYPDKVSRFLARHLLIKADGCVFQTKEARNWFPKALQDKSSIIMNATDPDFFDIERSPIKGRIVTCGRLVEQKNHKMLIEAFSKTIELVPDARLYIYGEGPLHKDLEDLIGYLGLKEKVFLKGVTNNVPEVLRQADIFVLSSNYEGMPNALIEALAAGVPAIATDCPCGGPRMIIQPEVNGLLIPLNNANDLKESLCKLLNNDSYKMKLATSAREKAEIFKPEKVFIQWEQFIEEVLSSDNR